MFGWVRRPTQILQAVVLPMQVSVGTGLLVWDGKEEWELPESRSQGVQTWPSVQLLQLHKVKPASPGVYSFPGG